MEAIQVNVRMDRALKRAGDVVLSERGCTPTRAVRALWEYLAVHASLPSALEHVLGQEDLDAAAGGIREERPCDEGARIVSGFYECLGIEEPSEPLDYEALRDQAAMERLGERGLA